MSDGTIDDTVIGRLRKIHTASTRNLNGLSNPRVCKYRIEPEGDNKFWAVEVRRLKDGVAFKNMEVTLGPAESVAQNVHYDDSERLALHYEITVGEALRYRGDISDNETVMLFRLPFNSRGVKFVAYTFQHIMVIHP
jgi:hypothetical protein